MATTLDIDKLAASKIALTLLKTACVCALIPSGISSVSGCLGPTPDRKTRSPASLA